MARHSLIAQLPRELREQIESFLKHRDGPITVDQFVAFLSEDLGLDIARSTAHRHLQKWQRAARRVRRVREFASAMSLELEEGKEDQTVRVLAETVADMAFEMVEAIQEGEAVGAKDLANLGRMVKDLSQGLALSAQRQLKIREETAKKLRKEAEEAVDRVAATQGLSRDTVTALKAEFLGIRG